MTWCSQHLEKLGSLVNCSALSPHPPREVELFYFHCPDISQYTGNTRGSPRRSLVSWAHCTPTLLWGRRSAPPGSHSLFPCSVHKAQISYGIFLHWSHLFCQSWGSHPGPWEADSVATSLLLGGGGSSVPFSTLSWKPRLSNWAHFWSWFNQSCRLFQPVLTCMPFSYPESWTITTKNLRKSCNFAVRWNKI